MSIEPTLLNMIFSMALLALRGTHAAKIDSSDYCACAIITELALRSMCPAITKLVL